MKKKFTKHPVLASESLVDRFREIETINEAIDAEVRSIDSYLRDEGSDPYESAAKIIQVSPMSDGKYQVDVRIEVLYEIEEDVTGQCTEVMKLIYDEVADVVDSNTLFDQWEITYDEPDNVPAINYDDAFKWNGKAKIPYKVTSVIIKDGVTEIPDGTLSRTTYPFGPTYRYSNLEYVKIPSSVKHIGAGVFLDCPELYRIDIAEGVQEIREDSFAWCRRLKYLRLPDSVKYIGERCFNWCASPIIVSISKDTDISDLVSSKSFDENDIKFEVR